LLLCRSRGPELPPRLHEVRLQHHATLIPP
jgi:hypothetical protein